MRTEKESKPRKMSVERERRRRMNRVLERGRRTRDQRGELEKEEEE